MASSKDYLQFVLEQLSELQEITYRAMMGEFIIYYRGKIVGGIYDDRLLVKPTKSAISYMPTVTYEIPYENSIHKSVSFRIDWFLKRHHLGVMMSFGCYFIGHIKAHSIVVNSW